jgi:hypothetical protein
MLVVGTSLIHAFHNAAGTTGTQRTQVLSWLSLTQAAVWNGPAHVKATFPTAVNVAGKDWEFPMPQPTIYARIDFRTNPVGTVRIVQVA